MATSSGIPHFHLFPHLGPQLRRRVRPGVAGLAVRRLPGRRPRPVGPDEATRSFFSSRNRILRWAGPRRSPANGTLLAPSSMRRPLESGQGTRTVREGLLIP